VTLRHDADATIREARRIVAMADIILDLAEREDRSPTILTRVDGYPAGGNGGGPASRNDAGQPGSTTERAIIAILNASMPGARTADPVGELIVSGLWSSRTPAGLSPSRGCVSPKLSSSRRCASLERTSPRCAARMVAMTSPCARATARRAASGSSATTTPEPCPAP